MPNTTVPLEALLEKLRKDGGYIIPCNTLTYAEQAVAYFESRVYEDADGFGYVYMQS